MQMLLSRVLGGKLNGRLPGGARSEVTVKFFTSLDSTTKGTNDSVILFRGSEAFLKSQKINISAFFDAQLLRVRWTVSATC